jgi:hypothetical protein
MARPLTEVQQDAMPRESWWCDVTRSAWWAMVGAHANRMRHSAFGRAEWLVLGIGDRNPRPRPKAFTEDL